MADIDFEKDFYAILEIKHSASAEEIKKAYRLMARRYHPDASDEPDAAERFHDIQTAYEILGNERLRASYDRMQRRLGLVPPDEADAVLAWELTVSRQTLPCIKEEQVLYLLIDIRPAASMEAKRLPLNLCLVIDRSTSMQDGRRMDQVKAAANHIIDDLRENDVFAVIAFSDAHEVVVPSQAEGDKLQAKAKISAIRPGGGTEIYQGLLAGVQELNRRRRLQAVSHLILLTDGQTYGDEQDCIQLAEDARRQGIGISAFGIGEDWNDKLLDTIASKSNGISAYIDSVAQVRRLLQQRVQGLSRVYARDLGLTLRFDQNTYLDDVFKLSPYIQRLDISTPDMLSLGSLEADRPLSILLQIVVGAHRQGRQRIVQLEVSGDTPAVGRRGEPLVRELWFHFAENLTTEPEIPLNLVNALQKLAIYHMQEQAYEALESGDSEKASEKLEVVATRLLDLGELELANAARLEAGRLAHSGSLSPSGRKKIKYGTRSLTISDTGGFL
jgi:Ca-activated chloride channel family protein